MKKSLLFIALAAVLLSFSSWNETEESTSIPYGHPDSTVKASLKILEKKYSAIPYFAKLDDQYLFYVVNGQWIDTSRTEFAKGKFLMGLVNEKGEVVLPVEYTKLYNPDATARGYIEIEKNGKRGLFNYHTRKVIAAEYDVIYSEMDWSAVGIGRIDSTFYFIYPNGSRNKFNLNEYEGWSRFFDYRGYTFSSRDKIHLLYETSLKEKVFENTYPNGVVFTPSFLKELNFQEKQMKMDFTEEFITGVNSISYEINSQRYKSSKNFYSFITSFTEKGLLGRGYVLEKSKIVTTDMVGRVIDALEPTEQPYSEPFYLYYFESDCSSEYSYHYYPYILNDSIIRIKCLRDSIEGINKYDAMSFSYFYKFNLKGKIEPLQSNRIFDMTKFMKMEISDFEGDFIKERSIESDSNGVHFSHLDIQDLELMRNEIFADYGYKFKSEKWQNYFQKKEWYKPLHDNVETQLSEIDKHNLKVIKEIEAKLKLNEMLFTKPRFVFYGWGY